MRKLALSFGYLLIFGIACFPLRAQDISHFTPDPEKVQKYLPYLMTRHGGAQGFEAWKSANTVQYFKELWYFTESFEVVRNYKESGVPLNEEIIDITRFESQRKQNEEAVVELPGFKDVLKLKAGKDLLYKPEY